MFYELVVIQTVGCPGMHNKLSKEVLVSILSGTQSDLMDCPVSVVGDSHQIPHRDM